MAYPTMRAVLIAASIITLCESAPAQTQQAPNNPIPDECTKLCPGDSCPSSCPSDGPQRGNGDRKPSNTSDSDKTPQPLPPPRDGPEKGKSR